MSETFVCEHCFQEFTLLEGAEEKAADEYRKYFPEVFESGEPKAIICDDCWVIIMNQ